MCNYFIYLFLISDRSLILASTSAPTHTLLPLFLFFRKRVLSSATMLENYFCLKVVQYGFWTMGLVMLFLSYSPPPPSSPLSFSSKGFTLIFEIWLEEVRVLKIFIPNIIIFGKENLHGYLNSWFAAQTGYES